MRALGTQGTATMGRGVGVPAEEEEGEARPVAAADVGTADADTP
jgi:hypothetical protein